MPRKGREFELAYADMYRLDSKKYTVESPGYIKDKITEANREVDVVKIKMKIIDVLPLNVEIEKMARM